MVRSKASGLDSPVTTPVTRHVNALGICAVFIIIGSACFSVAHSQEVTAAASSARMVIHRANAAASAKDTITLSQIKNLSFSSKNAGIRDAWLQKKPVSMKVFGNSRRILLTGVPGRNTTLSLFAVNGKKIYSSKVELSASGVGVVTLPSLTAGVYVARYITGTATIIQKIQKN
jgi:hypothetical protein